MGGLAFANLPGNGKRPIHSIDVMFLGAGHMADNTLVEVALSEIRVGAVCQADILGGDGVLLLKHGMPLDQSLYDQLIDRGVTALEVSATDVAALTGEPKQAAPPKARSHKAEANSSPARADRPHGRFDPNRVKQITSRITSVRSMLSRLTSGTHSPNAEFIRKLGVAAQGVVETVQCDADLALYVGSNARGLNTLADRSVAMSMMATAVAVDLGMPEETVGHLAMAGLIHDIGLCQLPAKFQDSSQFLTQDELWQYQHHPTMAADFVSDWTSIPEVVGVMVVQVHERPDGSGFPRGLGRSRIHRGAAMLGMVDSYLTLVCPGPGRPPVMPHDAMTCLSHMGEEGWFHPEQITAFRNQLTCYPIGSHVELDGGTLARVIRRDGDHCELPVVQPIPGKAGGDPDAEPSAPIELTAGERTIVQAMPDAGKNQMRLDADLVPIISEELLRPAGV